MSSHPAILTAGRQARPVTFGVSTLISQVSRGVDHVLAVETRGRGAVRDRRGLPRLALAIEERATEPEIAFVADRGTGVPELRRTDLVGRILDLAGDLAVADLVEQLSAELRVVALLVDRVGATAMDVEAAFDVLHHLRGRERRLAGRQRHVGHALELHVRPRIGIGTAVGFGLAEDVRLVAGG